MAYLIIFILTIISCLLFERLNVVRLVNNLAASYKQQARIMGDKSLSDEEKQKQLLSQTPIQLAYLGKLIGSILIFISPFILYVLAGTFFTFIKTEALYSLIGILVSIVAVIIYIIVKKQYAKLQQR